MTEGNIAELAGAITNVRDRLLLAVSALVGQDVDTAADELVAAANILRETIDSLREGAPA